MCTVLDRALHFGQILEYWKSCRAAGSSVTSEHVRDVLATLQACPTL